MRTQRRSHPAASREGGANLRRPSSCTGLPLALHVPRRTDRWTEREPFFWGSCTEREKATSQREEERGRKEERASPSTPPPPPPPPQLHRPHARPTRLELVDVELGGRVVRVPRARLGLARAGRRHLVKVVRCDRTRRARRARQARRRADTPDEVGNEAAGEGKREGEAESAKGSERERDRTRRDEETADAPSPARLVRRSQALAIFAIEELCARGGCASVRGSENKAARKVLEVDGDDDDDEKAGRRGSSERASERPRTARTRTRTAQSRKRGSKCATSRARAAVRQD